MKRTNKIITTLLANLHIGVLALFCASITQQAYAMSSLAKTALVSSSAIATTACVQSYRMAQPVQPPIVKQYECQRDKQIVYSNDSGVATLYVHGLGGQGSNAEYFAPVLPGNVFAFDFPDAPEAGCMHAHTGIGQPVEVRHLKEALRQLGDRDDVHTIFIFGISRGGATVVNLLKEADIPHIDKIAGVIIESAFAAIDDIIKLKLAQMGAAKVPGSRILGHAVVKVLYNQYSLANQPVDDLDTATDEAKKLPILMICSSEDALIPASSSERLTEQMCAAGFVAIEHHTLACGRHGGLLWGDSADEYIPLLGTFVQQCLHTRTIMNI